MRRFSYVLEWAGIVVRLDHWVPPSLAYFTNIPGVFRLYPDRTTVDEHLDHCLLFSPIPLALHDGERDRSDACARPLLCGNMQFVLGGF